MNLDKVFVFDIEATGLLDEIHDSSDLHVLSCSYKNREGKWTVLSTNKESDIKSLFGNPDNILVGHYVIMYDIPALQIMYPDIEFRATIVDTIGLSWYLYDERNRHNLEEWGKEFGIKKVEIDPSEWKNLSYEKAVERCEQDVRINTNLWVKFLRELRHIYDNDDIAVERVIRYLNFKLECLRDQERIRTKVDLKFIEKGFEFFLPIQEEKFGILKKVMPEVAKKAKRTKPKNLYKKGGELSEAGKRWWRLTRGCGLDFGYDGEIEEVVGYSEPNPQSPQQIKDWLYSLGWKPITFESRKNTKGEINEVPQINLKDGELCESVKKLIDREPAIEELEGLGIIKHRLGLLKSFRECEKDGYVVAGAHALANSLRLRHVRPIANLPSYTGDKDIADGYWIRGIICAPDGYEICGSDMESLEDRIKQHYIYPYDPEYVKDMMVEGFDPHLDLALMAGAMTPDEVKFLKWYKSQP